MNQVKHLGGAWLEAVLGVGRVIPVGILAGSASALFLWSLQRVTDYRFQYPWLLYLLPISGVIVAWMYFAAGKNAERGNNLLLEEIHQPGGGVPVRMAPLVLVGTLLTHLCGGSAGREGTAVQMGGSLAAAWVRWFRIDPSHLRTLLMAGIAGGFGSVFGTPLAGAIFAMEVLVIGKVQYEALIPVLVSAVVGDMTCSAWGIHHTQYHVEVRDMAGSGVWHGLVLLGKAAGAGILFGLVATLFSTAVHGLQAQLKARVKVFWLRPLLGGLGVIGLVHLVGTRDYLGLGVDSPQEGAVTILSCFNPGGATSWSWFWKLVFTVVTLGAGFKGGEVTPLFFIGAALGHVVGLWVGAPVDLFAALGFLAVFGAAANTPLACTVMGMELFGGGYVLHFGVACFVAFQCSPHRGIYRSQAVGVKKW